MHQNTKFSGNFETITANGAKKIVAINAKMFTVYDLAVNANPFKSWTLIFSSTGSRLRLSTRRINVYASKELGAESATMLKL